MERSSLVAWPPREGQRLYSGWSVLGQDVIFEGIEVGRLFECVFWVNVKGCSQIV